MPPVRHRTAPVVLLVQPHDDSREMYAEFFRHHNFEPVCPEDIAEATTLASTADVIVTELHLPVTFDGCEFIKRLRSDESTRHKPIIVLTSWAWQTDKLRAEEAGCNVFLTKPCLPDVLLRHVRRAMTSKRLSDVRGRSAKSGVNDSPLTRRPKRSA